MENTEPYTYKDLNEVPPHWRTYKGAKLNIDQINAIVADAYKHMIVGEESIIPDYGGARERFNQENQIEDNMWISKKSVGTSNPVSIDGDN